MGSTIVSYKSFAFDFYSLTIQVHPYFTTVPFYFNVYLIQKKWIGRDKRADMFTFIPPASMLFPLPGENVIQVIVSEEFPEASHTAQSIYNRDTGK